MTKQTGFCVKFAIENVAFDEDPLQEIARLLRYSTEAIEQGRKHFNLLDINGAHVGSGGFVFE